MNRRGTKEQMLQAIGEQAGFAFTKFNQGQIVTWRAKQGSDLMLLNKINLLLGRTFIFL